MKNCCNSNKKTKKCLRSKDQKIFSLPRRFSKKRCLKGKVKGFTMKSSCAPFKFCKKQKGGDLKEYLEDCLNSEDPVSLEEINNLEKDNIIKFNIREPTNDNNKTSNCYSKQSIKNHIEAKLSRGIQLDKIKDPVSNKLLGLDFIITNFPEYSEHRDIIQNRGSNGMTDNNEDQEGVAENIDTQLELLVDELMSKFTEINLEENESDYETLIEEFTQYLHRTVYHLLNNEMTQDEISEFLEGVNQIIEEMIDSANKKMLLENAVRGIREDLDNSQLGGSKKTFLYNPDDPKKSFDVYIDKNPNDTIPIKYTTVKDVEDTIKKLERLYKQGKYPHKRIWQVGMIMKVRLEAMKKHKKDRYPNAKNVTKRFNLSNRYFKFLKKRSKTYKNKRKKLNFKV